MPVPVLIARKKWPALFSELLQASIPIAMLKLVEEQCAHVLLAVGAPTMMPRGKFARFDITIDDSLVLLGRTSLPRQGRAEALHATELAVSNVTPFDAGQLLIHAGQEQPNTDIWTLTVSPSATVMRRLSELGIPLSRVRSLRPASNPAVDFLPLLAPRRRPLQQLAFVAAIVLIASGYAYDHFLKLGRTEQQNIIAEQQLADARDGIRLLTATLDERRNVQRLADADEALPTLRPSTYEALLHIRAAIPATSSISRLAVANGAVSLTVRSPDVLADTRALASKLVGWSVGIDGAVTRDDHAGEDVATLTLRPSDQL